MGPVFHTEDLQQLAFYIAFDPDMKYKPVPNLFHYTTNKILQNSILRKDCIDFLLTRADAFDDKQEGKYIVSCFKEVCCDCYNVGEISSGFCDLLCTESKEFSETCERLRNQYVLCF